MNQDRAQCEADYKRFIERVIANGIVWGLRHEKEGWAYSESNEYDDTDVLVFWSDEAYAKRQIKEDWSEYLATPILLNEFIDNWLKGMNDDQLLVGPNWDAHLCGLELEPIAVAKKLGG